MEFKGRVLVAKISENFSPLKGISFCIVSFLIVVM